jgi:DNA-binding MarR family transcriptional regulator
MEADLGLTSLSRNERDILIAAMEVGQQDDQGRWVFSTDMLRQRSIASYMAQPTFHRALRKLIDKGLVKRNSEKGLGVYAAVVVRSKHG